MKRIYLFTSLLVVLSLLLTVVPAQAEQPGTFHMDKTCGGSGCVISNASAPFDVFNGATAVYEMYHYAPDAAGNMHMTAGITLTSLQNAQDTVSGIVSWVYHNGEFTGHISLQSGTGAFEGIHANGVIGLDTWPTAFYFEGNYHFAP